AGGRGAIGRKRDHRRGRRAASARHRRADHRARHGPGLPARQDDHRARARPHPRRGPARRDRRRRAGARSLSRRPEAAMSGLVLDKIVAGYGETVVLEDVSLSLPPGGTLAILGRNGVGKTTLVSTIMGHATLRRGNIRFGDTEIARLPPYRRARLGIGLVPQEREIFGSLTVDENLSIAARLGKWSVPRVYDFFPGLAARRTNRGNQLSGGEQQMLAIGRALMG